MRNRERRKVLYAAGIVLAVILIFGSLGAIDHDAVTISQGLWQIVAAAGLLSWCWYGFRLERRRESANVRSRSLGRGREGRQAVHVRAENQRSA